MVPLITYQERRGRACLKLVRQYDPSALRGPGLTVKMGMDGQRVRGMAQRATRGLHEKNYLQLNRSVCPLKI